MSVVHATYLVEGSVSCEEVDCVRVDTRREPYSVRGVLGTGNSQHGISEYAHRLSHFRVVRARKLPEELVIGS